MIELHVVPDPLVYQKTEPLFRPLSSYNRYPIHSVRQTKTDVLSRYVGMGIITPNEARDLLGLKGF